MNHSASGSKVLTQVIVKVSGFGAIDAVDPGL